MSAKEEILIVLQNSLQNPKTVVTYLSCIYNLVLKVVKDSHPEQNIIDVLKSKETESLITNYIENNVQNPASRVKHYCALLKLQPEYADVLELLKRKSQEIVTENYKDQMLQSSRTASVIGMGTRETLRQKHDLFLDRFKTDNLPRKIESAQNAFITGMMTGIYEGCPPRRLQDYYCLILNGEDPETNHFIENKSKIVFNVHKMSGRSKIKGTTKATIVFKVPEPLLPIVEFLCTVPGRVFLLETRKQKQFNAQTLSAHVKGIFGFSCDVLRILYCSEKYKDVPSVREIEKTALQMGHSMNTALNCYVKK